MQPDNPEPDIEVEAHPAKKKSSLKKRAVIGGVGIAVLVGTFVFILPRIADYRSV